MWERHPHRSSQCTREWTKSVWTHHWAGLQHNYRPLEQYSAQSPWMTFPLHQRPSSPQLLHDTESVLWTRRNHPGTVARIRRSLVTGNLSYVTAHFNHISSSFTFWSDLKQIYCSNYTSAHVCDSYLLFWGSSKSVPTYSSESIAHCHNVNVLQFFSSFSLILSFNDFQNGGRSPSWILKIRSFCHVAFVGMPLCFLLQNFAEIGQWWRQGGRRRHVPRL